jgi:hypothetical protein
MARAGRNRDLLAHDPAGDVVLDDIARLHGRRDLTPGRSAHGSAKRKSNAGARHDPATQRLARYIAGALGADLDDQ